MTKIRRISQIAGIAFGIFGITGIGMTHIIFPGLHCYACPGAVTVCPIGLMQNLIAFGTVPFFWLGAIAAYGLLAGRGFCGWFCPFGTLNDLLSFRKVRILKSLSYGKFAILLATIVAAYVFADTMFCKLCPAASLTASLPYLTMGVAEVNQPFLVHMAILAAVLVGMIAISRFWCRYLCPMGALLGLFNRFSLVHLKLDTDQCAGCSACAPSCPMGLDPHLEHDDHNCIKCGECVEGCHLGALSLRCGPQKGDR